MTPRAELALPADLRAMLDAVRRVGRPRLVGGGVRDWLLGLAPKDFDLEVGGVDFETLRRTLEPFGATDVIGRSFGVIKVRSRATGEEYDFSLPRRESKTGSGHRGFAVAPDPALNDAEAAARRDFTVNAIACDPFSGELIDPHGGRRDLEARVLRHTSAAFSEDPLRVLRAMQLAARFDFSLAPETAALSRSIAETFSELPLERVWGEWEKWATKAARPSRGLAVLEEAGKFAADKFAQAMLPVKDSLEAALATDNATLETLRQGVELTHSSSSLLRSRAPTSPKSTRSAKSSTPTSTRRSAWSRPMPSPTPSSPCCRRATCSASASSARRW